MFVLLPRATRTDAPLPYTTLVRPARTCSRSRADAKLLSPMSPSPSAAQHYAREGALTGRILSALTAAGKDLDRLTAEDLSPYDQFHSRGSQATADRAQLRDPQMGQDRKRARLHSRN